MIIVDCSHANSKKNHTLQGKVMHDVINQVIAGETAIKGLMLESYLKAGNQPLKIGNPVAPDISITDACISFEETENLILEAYEKL